MCYKHAMTGNEINNIEETLAHQEQQISDLSEMVIRQGNEIERLKKHLLKLQGKIGVIEETAGTQEGEGLSAMEQAERDKPPHY